MLPTQVALAIFVVDVISQFCTALLVVPVLASIGTPSPGLAVAAVPPGCRTVSRACATPAAIGAGIPCVQVVGVGAMCFPRAVVMLSIATGVQTTPLLAIPA